LALAFALHSVIALQINEHVWDLLGHQVPHERKDILILDGWQVTDIDVRKVFLDLCVNQSQRLDNPVAGNDQTLQVQTDFPICKIFCHSCLVTPWLPSTTHKLKLKHFPTEKGKQKPYLGEEHFRATF